MLLFAEEAHEAPLIVQFINHYFGEPFYNFEMNVTKPLWDKFLGFSARRPRVNSGRTRRKTRFPGTR